MRHDLTSQPSDKEACCNQEHLLSSLGGSCEEGISSILSVLLVRHQKLEHWPHGEIVPRTFSLLTDFRTHPYIDGTGGYREKVYL